jgi:uncharacterized protein (DUF1800 family)
VSLPVYDGRFEARHAERLLWRAGFGPRPGEAQKLARKGLKRAVLSLTRPKGKVRLIGPDPHDEDGLPLDPTNAYGHDMLWWLDRMVRSNQPLLERMALNWHDWFATGDVGQSQLSLDQNELFRRSGMGSFSDLLLEVTKDPAMLVWLSGNENTAEGPNENYARELMELFTLGAGAGYTEADVREQARALTGWTNDWDDDIGSHNFHFDPERFDPGPKRIFGQVGNFDWKDSCRLCLEHPAHAGFFVTKLWSYFVPTPPPKKTLRDLKKLYKKRKYAIRPVVEAILMHPALHTGPRMIKPPIVQIAGMHRGRKAGITTESWSWISDQAGQRPFDPPNVAGWDETRWLDTARLGGRWDAGTQITREDEIDSEAPYDAKETSKEALNRALRYWGKPTLTDKTRKELLRFGNRVEAIAKEDWQKESYRALRQNALRTLIVTSPDYETS